nr:MAG: putative RNA-dependent RNA polymerase [Gammapartitivirus sp.]
MIDKLLSTDIDDISNSNPGGDVGAQPGVESTFIPSSRTSARHRSVGGFFVGQGLKEIARYGGYSTYQPGGNTDAWVRESLKLFTREGYDSLFGFTRKGQGIDGMYKALFKYDEAPSSFHSLSSLQRRSMIAAIDLARKKFRLPYKHEPLDWHEVGQFVRTDTSAGVSFMGKRKSEVMPQIFTEARWLGHRMKEGGKSRFDPRQVRFPPCLAGQRGHMSPRDDPKTRLVWIYPAEMLVVEGLWAPVMYKSFEDLPDSPLLYGKSAQRLYTEWCVNYKSGEKLHGIDFSSFDTKVPAWLIHVAFDIMHSNVDWLSWRGKPTTKRSRQKWRNVWDGAKWYFINTPVLMPDGRMFRKRLGVPSGSWFTQLVDSIVNYILVQYLCLCQGMEAGSLKVLGDDSAFRNTQGLDLVQAASDSGVLSMVLNVDKCEVSEDPGDFKLLGTSYRQGHQWRSDEEWFKLALYPENPPPDIGTSLSRLVGLWLGGAMWSSNFCSFMEFFQTCYACPKSGWFSKDQRRWLEIVYGSRSPRGWTTKKSLFWKSIFYVL